MRSDHAAQSARRRQAIVASDFDAQKRVICVAEELSS